MDKSHLKRRTIKILVLATSILIVTVSILSVVKPSVELVYMGTDTTAKNWFIKGEEAKMYFKISNPTLGDGTFEIYLKPMDDPSRPVRVSSLKVKAMESRVYAVA
ncbi:MAG: hypothetical protein QXM01_05625, partial [Candidatus Bathyarchaeia archaeon]